MAQMQAPLSLNNLVIHPASGGGPLSGDVAQNILPWRWMFDWIGNQFSFLTINLGRSSAPEVETEILDKVGSYGRQLGRVSEALEILVRRLQRDQLTDDERDAIDDFLAQMREIKKIKQTRLRTKPLT